MSLPWAHGLSLHIMFWFPKCVAVEGIRHSDGLAFSGADLHRAPGVRGIYSINSCNELLLSAGSGYQEEVTSQDAPKQWKQRLTSLHRSFDNPVSTAVYSNTHAWACCFPSWEKIWSAARRTLLREESLCAVCFNPRASRCAERLSSSSWSD